MNEPNTIPCIACEQMTWREQRRQFARAIGAGLTPEEAKALMPRCQRCTTSALRARGLRAPAPRRRISPYAG